MRATAKVVMSRAEVGRFNSRFPVGSTVDVKLDSGEVKRSTVRFPAVVSNSGHAVAWLHGVSGYYLASRVSAVEVENRSQPTLL